MRALVQRVSSARVEVDGKVLGDIGIGFLVYVGVHRDDTEDDVARLADRLVGLRIFNDADGRINLSISDLPDAKQAKMLLISNFTLYGEALKSRRPSFTASAGFEQGSLLFGGLLEQLRSLGVAVETGEFGADMQVTSTNDGPVNVLIETRS